jgi:HK97 family phage major capsid protein
MASKLIEAREELNGKRKQLADIFAAYPNLDMSADVVEDIQKRNNELTDLGKAYDVLADLDTAQQANAAAIKAMITPNGGSVFSGASDAPAGKAAASRKSLGQQWVESDAFKSWRAGGGQRAVSFEAPDLSMLGLKATFTTATSTLTSFDRPPGIVVIGNQRLTVLDLIATGTTNANTIRYVQEDTYTNAATAVTEGLIKPEATFDTSEVDAPVRKIAVTAKVTDELFNDFPAMASYVDARLRFMVEERVENLILTGNGVAPNLLGINATVGVLTQAKGADPTPDAVYKAMVQVMTTGFFQPDGVVMHPLDWQDIRLLRTVDGIYIWGNPSEAGPERIWGLPVVVTVNQTQNTGLVGAFRLGAQYFERDGLSVESTNSNEDDFRKNLIALRAETRGALAVYRPKAFCLVTGI